MRGARRLLPIAVVYTAALWLALAGLDFGHHWDELKLLNSDADAIRTGLLLPRWYNYPSLSFDLVMGATAPDAAPLLGARLLGAHGPERADVLSDLADRTVYSTSFRLRVRTLFAALSLLAIVWTYAWALASGAGVAQAVLAGAILACSWQVGYHARWIAPDAVLMQFAAATLAALAIARQRGPRAATWLDAAAVMAGLALSTKYPGGVLLVPVLLVSFLLGRSVREHVRLFALFAAVFLATSPGVVLEPGRFVSDLSFEIAHYRGGHGCYTVGAGFEHAWLLLRYLALELLAPWQAAALVLFMLAVAGAVHVAVRDRATAAVVLSVPVLYLVYMSTQRVMIVRNYLIVAPFFAYLAAHGAVAVGETIRNRGLRLALASALGIVLAASIVWQARAAYTIGAHEAQSYANDVDAYLRAYPKRRFAVSPAVRRLMADAPAGWDANVVADAASADGYVLESNEVGDWKVWIANRAGVYREIAGPREVDFDYYPSWAGPPRVVEVTVDTARKLKLVEPNGIEPSTS